METLVKVGLLLAALHSQLSYEPVCMVAFKDTHLNNL